MRPIKFRIWDKKHKVMVWPESDFSSRMGPMMTLKGQFYEEDSKGVPPPMRGFKYVDNLELMQFTGLLDTKGKEIWEGDIVRSPTGFIKKVEFGVEEHFQYGHGDSTKTVSAGFHFSDYSWNSPNGFEVIGNVYENPELLKKTKIKYEGETK